MLQRNIKIWAGSNPRPFTGFGWVRVSPAWYKSIIFRKKILSKIALWMIIPQKKCYSFTFFFRNLAFQCSIMIEPVIKINEWITWEPSRQGLAVLYWSSTSLLCISPQLLKTELFINGNAFAMISQVWLWNLGKCKSNELCDESKKIKRLSEKHVLFKELQDRHRKEL